MIIKNISINGVGGIGDISIVFNDKMNIICGPNGIGKTTILECVAHMFTAGETTILKRNVKYDLSKILATVEVDGIDISNEIEFKGFSPEIRNVTTSGHRQYSQKLLALKTSRNFQYTALHAVGKDTKKQDTTYWQDSKDGVILTDVKNWFVNRYLYSAHIGALSKEQISNFELAKSAFSLLNSQFKFSRVEASSNEIMVLSPSGEIYYEYLSSGFKSILSIVFGIIKEIEYRFIEPRVEAKNFDGIILIDELELHLHPKWQESVAGVLSGIFPQAQFIATTHSPHIIQFAKPNQVIALGLINDNVVQRQLINNDYGFQGWTIDEILTDVMDMEDTRSIIFKTMIQQFEIAIEKENYNNAKNIFEKLNEMMHPQNILKKLLKFQLASISRSSND